MNEFAALQTGYTPKKGAMKRIRAKKCDSKVRKIL